MGSGRGGRSCERDRPVSHPHRTGNWTDGRGVPRGPARVRPVRGNHRSTGKRDMDLAWRRWSHLPLPGGNRADCHHPAVPPRAASVARSPIHCGTPTPNADRGCRSSVPPAVARANPRSSRLAHRCVGGAGGDAIPCVVVGPSCSNPYGDGVGTRACPAAELWGESSDATVPVLRPGGRGRACGRRSVHRYLLELVGVGKIASLPSGCGPQLPPRVGGGGRVGVSDWRWLGSCGEPYRCSCPLCSFVAERVHHGQLRSTPCGP